MIRRGDYVLCNFPFRESRGPGPSPHIVLCAAVGRERNTRYAIVYYTTTKIDFEGAKRPRQYLFVSQTRAIELGQKTAFHVDASRVACLPLVVDYFPELNGNTIPVKSRDSNFVNKVEARMWEISAAGIAITKVDAVFTSRLD
jgi:hypothetical protein